MRGLCIVFSSFNKHFFFFGVVEPLLNQKMIILFYKKMGVFSQYYSGCVKTFNLRGRGNGKYEWFFPPMYCCVQI